MVHFGHMNPNGKNLFLSQYESMTVTISMGVKDSWKFTFERANKKQKEHTGKSSQFWNIKAHQTDLPRQTTPPKPTQTISSAMDHVFRCLEIRQINHENSIWSMPWRFANVQCMSRLRIMVYTWSMICFGRAYLSQ